MPKVQLIWICIALMGFEVYRILRLFLKYGIQIGGQRSVEEVMEEFAFKASLLDIFAMRSHAISAVMFFYLAIILSALP